MVIVCMDLQARLVPLIPPHLPHTTPPIVSHLLSFSLTHIRSTIVSLVSFPSVPYVTAQLEKCTLTLPVQI